MANSKTLVSNLKAALKSRGVTYRELARRLKVSEPTVKRDLSRGIFTLPRLDQICEVVGIDLEELVHPSAPGAPLTQLSDLGTAFLGSQGDIWDAQKDMALASLGALITMGVAACVNMAYQRDFAREWADSFRIRGHEPLGEVAIAKMRAETSAP